MDPLAQNRRQVRLANAVHLLAKPLDRPTSWAARVVIDDTLRRQGKGDMVRAPHPGPTMLRLAETVNRLAQPLNRATLWAARVRVKQRLHERGIIVGQGERR